MWAWWHACSTIDMAEVEKAIRKQFAKKVKAANLNLAAAQAGFEYAKAKLQKRGVFYIERMDKTAGKIIIDGNSAAALGCMFAGCTVVTWYPITPSSSLVETMIEYMKEYRIGPDGKATFAIVQAEDELAAIGMVIGAGWAGARVHDRHRRPGNFSDVGICRAWHITSRFRASSGTFSVSGRPPGFPRGLRRATFFRRRFCRTGTPSTSC